MGRKRGKNGVPLPLGGKDGPKELYWGREGTSPEKDKVAAEPENDSFEKTKKVKMEVVEKLEGPRGKRRRKEAAVKDVVEVKVEKNGEVVVKEEKDAKEIARLKETKEERRKKILQKMKALGAKKGHPLLDEEVQNNLDNMNLSVYKDERKVNYKMLFLVDSRQIMVAVSSNVWRTSKYQTSVYQVG